MNTSKDLSCSEIIEFLDDYTDKKLPADRYALFEEHLAVCSDCVAYLASYRRTIALTHDVKTLESVADNAPADLVEAILAARRRA
ncbi:MAG: anti-sigma factor [Granulosicoccus sp.]